MYPGSSQTRTNGILNPHTCTCENAKPFGNFKNHFECKFDDRIKADMSEVHPCINYEPDNSK